MLKDFILTFYEANNEIQKYIEKKEYEVAKNLLGQCQDGGYSLIDFIVDLEGEGNLTLEYVQDYCDLIFKIYNELGTEENTNYKNMVKLLKKALVKIENSISNDIIIKTEILFLPYKSSMWDSMESVWEAAEQDENCEAFVMPIPYYDRNLDGSFKTYYYEGDKFPKGIHITDYKSYNIEENKPDIIYVHNPYDGSNFVTSVDPAYYSKELKKNTDLLVYIPYYSKSAALGKVGRMNSSYFNFDSIILQSEDMIDFIDSQVPREKLVPLGSPKFDRVIKFCNKDFDLPKDWENKILGKKVYFYNTSLGGMLESTDEFILKMKYVFETFANRNDVCLLWRPHPLFESTITSMRPSYTETFFRLKYFFIQNSIGIYDDTPDVEKAIAISDAYIGDLGSSVVSLFIAANKEIYTLNNSIHREPKENDYIGDILRFGKFSKPSKWFAVKGEQLFVRADDSYNYGLVDSLNKNGNDNIYSNGIESNGKVFMVPRIGEYILVYENNKLIKEIKMSILCSLVDVTMNTVLLNDVIYIVPSKGMEIICLNTKTYKLNYTKGYSKFSLYCYTPLLSDIITWKNFIVISSSVDDSVTFLNSENLEIQMLKIGVKDAKGYVSVLAEGDNLWCLPNSTVNNIIKWNPLNGEHKEYELPSNLKNIIFNNGVFYKNKLILAPKISNTFVVFDLETENFEEINIFDNDNKIDNCYFSKCLNYCFIGDVKDDLIEVYNGKYRSIYTLNLETKKYSEEKISFDKESVIKTELGFSNGKKINRKFGCLEDGINSLEDMLDNNITGNRLDKKKQLEDFKKIAVNSDGTCGAKIHEYTINKLTNKINRK